MKMPSKRDIFGVVGMFVTLYAFFVFVPILERAVDKLMNWIFGKTPVTPSRFYDIHRIKKELQAGSAKAKEEEPLAAESSKAKEDPLASSSDQDADPLATGSAKAKEEEPSAHGKG
jgi:hypothetical protein